MKMSEVPNPFVGLRPYEPDESLLFFGRRQQIAELLRRLHDLRFLAVVGSSGCGKSSLVRAGLIPVLQAGFLVEERDSWLLCVMKPGDAPLANLASSVMASSTGRDTVPTEETAELLKDIRERGAPALLEALYGPLKARDANLLLLVDQFEEIFRFVDGGAAHRERDEACDFVSILMELAAQRRLGIYVIITMRSDFLGDCDAFAGLPEALNLGQYLVPRLTREQRRDAIEGPVRLYRQDIAARLTDRLLNETIDTRDDLPVLQHALMRTWDAWCGIAEGPVDIEHYEKIGTIKLALSRDADAALEGMTPPERLLTRRVFQALTTVDASNRGIRRPAKLDDIAARCQAQPGDVWKIIERFRRGGRSYLVVSVDRPDANPMIDISHESLIRQWQVLGEWVAEEAESIKNFKRLVESARLHRAGKAGLYRDLDLQTALDWEAAHSPNEAWARDQGEDWAPAKSFLDASKVARDVALAENEFLVRWRRLRLGIGAFVLLLFFASFGVEPIKSLWDSSEAMFGRALTRKAEALVQAHSGSEVSVQATIDQVPAMANALAEMFKFGLHVLLFMALTYVAKRVYRHFAYKPIHAEVSARRVPQPRARWTTTKMANELKRRVPRAIESIGKWISVLAGVATLSTCSVIGVASGGAGWFAALGGIAVGAVLVGWVFAISRLNSEVKALRALLPNEPAGNVAPPAEAAPRRAG